MRHQNFKIIVFGILILALALFMVVLAVMLPQNQGDSSGLEIHFIDVGQGDSALVCCSGHYMLVDGGNKADSSLIFSYLEKQRITDLDVIVCTHAHEDHVGGLSGALQYASVDTALCPVSEYDSDAFSDFVTALKRQNVELTVPVSGESFSLGNATVTVLGPIEEAEGNNSSIVLKIVYKDTSFILAGDAEVEEEKTLIDAGYDLTCDVLKIAHHGSDSSSCYQFLYEAMPSYAIISVGEDNSYGHPSENVLSRLRDADVTVFRTDMQGTIICKSNGTDISFSTEKNTNIDTLSTVRVKKVEDNEYACEVNLKGFVLNTNTGKFHLPSCSCIADIKDGNKEYYEGKREDVVAMGYTPCGSCNP